MLNQIKKFIPKEYKYDSLSNRLKLIRGLMDTDGSILKWSRIYKQQCLKD